MKHRLAPRGITFYKLLSAFFVTTFVCAFIITGQYLYSLSRQEKQLYHSYEEMTQTAFQNISVFADQFDSFGNHLTENQALDSFQDVISADRISEENEQSEALWKKFSQLYNSQMSGAANIAYLYLKNSGYVYGLGSAKNANSEIQNLLGLREEQWNTLKNADEHLCVSIVKTDQMDYGRLMMAQEISPGIVLIVGVAEDHFLRFIQSGYLPSGAQITLVSSDNQSLSFDTGQETTSVNYQECSFSDFSQIADTNDFYYFSASLYHDTIKARIAIPTRYYKEKMHTLFLSILLALGIWVVLGGGFSYFLTARLYQPIENLLNTLPKETAPGKHVHEFRLIHNTLQTLEDKNHVYEEMLRSQNQYLAYNLWIRILHNELSVTPEIETLLIRSGFPEHLSSYMVCQFIFMPLPEAEQFPPQSAGFVEEACRTQGLRTYIAEDDPYLIVLIETADQNHETVAAFLQGLSQNMQQQLHIQVSIAASAIHTLPADIPDAYQEAVQLTEYIILLDDYDGVYFWDARANSLDSSGTQENRRLKLIQKISACISCGRFSDASSLLDELFAEFAPPSSGFLLENTRDVLYLLDTFIVSFDRKYEDIISQLTINRQALRKKSLKELKAYLQQLLMSLEEQNNDTSLSRQKAFMIRDYIHNHYQDCNLSAQTVADEFNISIPWLSTTFKRELNEGFLEYLHRYRITRIQEMIESTDLSLKEIAEKNGYANYVTMSRAFKRYVGVTPKNYRENHAKEV